MDIQKTSKAKGTSHFGKTQKTRHKRKSKKGPKTMGLIEKFIDKLINHRGEKFVYLKRKKEYQQ